MTNLYGNTVDVEDIHGRVTAFIAKWSPSYLAEFGRRKGFLNLPAFQSYTNVDTMDKWPEDALPAVVTFIPGTNGTPEKQGDGSYTAEWPVGIGIVMSSKDREETRKLLTLYMLAIRAMFVQHGSLDDFSESTVWEGDSYDDLPFNASRTIQAGIVSFGIKINNVVESAAGLSTLPEDPSIDPGNYGRVVTADVQVEALV